MVMSAARRQPPMRLRPIRSQANISKAARHIQGRLNPAGVQN